MRARRPGFRQRSRAMVGTSATSASRRPMRMAAGTTTAPRARPGPAAPRGPYLFLAALFRCLYALTVYGSRSAAITVGSSGFTASAASTAM